LETLFRPPHPARKGREIPISTLYTRLGLTPYDRKANFVTTDLQPDSVTIPLAAHIGAPAQPTVGEGDAVRRGDVIGIVADAQLGCPVHASIAGRVSAVTAQTITIVR
jgi:Na+-translocating ferredoxin:NAD+ oxidoreductase RnfC subunit